MSPVEEARKAFWEAERDLLDDHLIAERLDALEAALRVQHFQEAAEALEREGDLLGDAQTNFRWAAAFLRGVQ